MISRAVSKLIDRGIKGPRLSINVGALTLCMASLGLSRIHLTTDMSALLTAEHSQLGRDFDDLLHFSGAQQLYFHIQCNETPRCIAAADALETRLKNSPLFSAVRFRIGALDLRHLVDTAMPLRFLLDPRPADTMLSETSIATQVQELRAALLAPNALLTQDLLARDPSQSLTTFLEQAPKEWAAPSGFTGSLVDGRIRSQDGKSLLGAAVPLADISDSNAARTTYQTAQSAVAEVLKGEPHTRIDIVGGHRFATEARAMIERDVHTSIWGSLLAAFGVFFVFFRRTRLLVLALPPLLTGASVALFTAGLLGTPIHPIVLAFVGAALGLSTDSTIHLLSALPMNLSPRKALQEASQAMGGSLVLVMTTTAVGLLALLVSDAPALWQMGLLASLGVAGAFLGTLVWLPVLLPHLAPEVIAAPALAPGVEKLVHRFLPTSPAAKKSTWVAVILFALVAGTLSLHVSIDQGLGALDTRTASAQEAEQRLSKSFGDPTRMALLTIRAPTVVAALAKLASVEALVTPSGVVLQGAGLLARAAADLAKQKSAWCNERPVSQQRWRNALVGAGLNATGFSAFFTDWDEMCSASDASMEVAWRQFIVGIETVTGRPLLQGTRDGVTYAATLSGSADALTRAQTVIERSPGSGARFLSRPTLIEQLVARVRHELPRVAATAFGLVLLLLFFHFRNLWQPWLALLPCLLSLLTLFAFLKLTHTDLNLMHLCVFPILAGVGIDYGIVIADTPATNPHMLAERAFGLMVAACTTLADFGGMAVAQHRALSTLGQSVIVSVAAAAFFALWVSPLLRRRAPPHT